MPELAISNETRPQMPRAGPKRHRGWRVLMIEWREEGYTSQVIYWNQVTVRRCKVPLLASLFRLDPSSVPATITCFALDYVAEYKGGGLHVCVPPMLLPLFTRTHVELTTVVGTHEARIVK